MNTLRNLGAGPGPTLASFGQRYQDAPPATFDQRFGPYQAPGPTDEARDQLRRLIEEQMLRNTPEGIVPGQRTWPYGYIQTEAPRPTLQQLAGDVIPMPMPYSSALDRLRRADGEQGRRDPILPPLQIIPFPTPKKPK